MADIPHRGSLISRSEWRLKVHDHSDNKRKNTVYFFTSLQINRVSCFTVKVKGKRKFDVCKKNCLSHDGCHSDLHPVSQHDMMH